jgi:glycosyltransferase involved in cell wall biosynthesis
MPNAEWFKPEDPDIAAVSAFIAPTIACFEMLKSCNCGSRTTYIPHAIDTERFSFRRRETAETFLHCSGWGGHKDRKGTDIVFRVAEACPEIPVVIRSQKFCQYSLPNIIIHGPTIDPEMQYDRGDICVQPSRWEGVGLQILEAMACGLPTVVPDAPPMNEYQADSVLRVKAHSGPVLVGTKPWTQWEIDHESLAATLRRLHHQQIGDLSIRARKFVEQRSWAVLKADYMRLIGF